MDTVQEDCEPLISVDWVTIKMKKSANPCRFTLQELTSFLLTGSQPEEWRCVDPRHHRIAGYHCSQALTKSGMYLLYGNRHEYVYAVLSGRAVRRFILSHKFFKGRREPELASKVVCAIIDHGWTFHELHIAFDDRAGILPLNEIVRKGLSGQNGTPKEFRGDLKLFDPRQRVKHDQYVANGGVFGKKAYGTEVSFYDKNLEGKRLIDSDGVRAEVRCHGESAENLAREIARFGLAISKKKLADSVRFIEPEKARTNTKKPRSRKHPGFLREDKWPTSPWWEKFIGPCQFAPLLGSRSEIGMKQDPRKSFQTWHKIITAVIDLPDGLDECALAAVRARKDSYGKYEGFVADHWEDANKLNFPSADQTAKLLATLFPLQFLVVVEAACRDPELLRPIVEECRAKASSKGLNVEVLLESLFSAH